MQAPRPILATLRSEQGLACARSLLADQPRLARTALADRLCERLQLLDARGRLRRAGCLKALRLLDREGLIALPAPARGGGGGGVRRLPGPVAAPQEVGEDLAGLGELEVVLVEGDAQRAIWNELMAREHPRGAGPLVGCQLRYLIGSAQGWLAALGFGAPALKLAAREAWIGWSASQREAHRHRVVGLNRLLIRPQVRCRHLASHVLGRVLRRLGDDFAARYGYRPWLVETFVDPARHEGTCFAAANWRHVGDSGGRGRDDRDHAGAVTRKAIYVYALERDWRARLGVAPPGQGVAALAPGEGLERGHWAEQEFGEAPLGDRRLSRRLVDSASMQAEEPMRAFTGLERADRAQVKGYYRLIDQPAESEVTAANILAPHRARTRQRMQGQATVLCIQDTTTLNFSTRAQTRGLGVIGSNQTASDSRGVQLHSTLAVADDGLPLGVVRAQFDAPGAQGQTRKSDRWIAGLRDCAELAEGLCQTRVISVADREADFHELFAEQQRHPGVELIVRAQHNRRLPGESQRLFQALAAQPPSAHIRLDVTRESARTKTSKHHARIARQARTATLALRYRRVEIAAPERRGAALTLSVVHAREEQPPSGESPIEWFVLTTLDVDSGDDAAAVLRYYGLRWRIEDFHRVLKSGCRIDELAHNSFERLERAIAMRMVIAWRVMLMTLLGREAPQLDAEFLFSDVELRVLGDYAQSRRRQRPTQLDEAVRVVAMLGGYLNRNNDPPPGHQLLWHGIAKLATMTLAYELRDQSEP